jgi:hypothetical protein
MFKSILTGYIHMALISVLNMTSWKTVLFPGGFLVVKV